MREKKHFLTLAVLPKEKYEWELIKVEYESYLTPNVWLKEYWKDYENYKKVVVVDDNAILKVWKNE